MPRIAILAVLLAAGCSAETIGSSSGTAGVGATGSSATSSTGGSTAGSSSSTGGASSTGSSGAGLLALPIRVNAGGPAYTDGNGASWSADFGYSGGLTYSNSATIAHSSATEIFHTERYGDPANGSTFSYSFAVPNGDYAVVLHFAETILQAPGARTFDVKINGATALRAFDILAAAGEQNVAVASVVPATVTNQQLQIEFTPEVENPKVNAIEILRSDEAPAISPEAVGNHVNIPSDSHWPSIPFGTLRLWDDGTSWTDIQGAGSSSYDWSSFDYWLQKAAANHLDVIYTFGRTPGWAATQSDSNCAYGPDQCAVPDLNAWDSFVNALVDRSLASPTHIHYYEVWNEPDDPNQFMGTDADLVKLAQHLRAILNAKDPDARVLGPGFDWHDSASTAACTRADGSAIPTGSPAALVCNFLAAGGAREVDAVAYHGYLGTVPESINAVTADLLTVMAQQGLAEKPLIDTESSWGASNGAPTISDLQAQAAFLARSYLLQLTRGNDRFVWYGWDFGPWGGEWDPQNGLYPDGVAAGSIDSWLVGASIAAPCAPSAADADLWTCRFWHPGGQRAEAVWSTQGTKTLTVEAPYTEWRDLTGQATQAAAGATVAVGGSPIWLDNGP